MARSCPFVRSSRKSAGEARYTVLLHRHTVEPLSSRFFDTRLPHVHHGHGFGAGDVVLAAVARRSLQGGSTVVTISNDFAHLLSL